jgi:branched-chain amino acid transport system permease protein
MTKTTRFLGFAALLVIIMGILPLILPSYYTGLLTLMFIYALFAMSLDILQGYTGLASLGHAAFFGTAAYVVGVLNVKVFHGPHLGVELVSGILGAALTAAILGLIVLRSAGVYLLMILMASSMMLWGIAFKWRSLAGGDDGLPGIVRPDLAFLHMDLKQTTDFYYFILFFFVVGSALMYLVVRSSFGHTLLGIRESETRMKALGYNTWLQKYIAFIVSAAFAGLAGVLLAYYNGFVSPAELHLVNSAEVLIMVILGGVGTLFGPAIGAGIIILIKNIVSGYTEHWMIILGAVYMATVMLAPQGVYRLIENLVKAKPQEETTAKEEEKGNL